MSGIGGPTRAQRGAVVNHLGWHHRSLWPQGRRRVSVSERLQVSDPLFCVQAQTSVHQRAIASYLHPRKATRTSAAVKPKTKVSRAEICQCVVGSGAIVCGSGRSAPRLALADRDREGGNNPLENWGEMGQNGHEHANAACFPSESHMNSVRWLLRITLPFSWEILFAVREPSDCEGHVVRAYPNSALRGVGWEQGNPFDEAYARVETGAPRCGSQMSSRCVAKRRCFGLLRLQPVDLAPRVRTSWCGCRDLAQGADVLWR
jgi:hypothetical protein